MPPQRLQRPELDDQLLSISLCRWHEKHFAQDSDAETTDYDDANLMPQVLSDHATKRAEGDISLCSLAPTWVARIGLC